QEPHRFSTIARFAIARGGKQLGILEPRMSQYRTMRETIGSPAVHTTALRDFYISIANINTGAQTATVTIYVSPLVVWIWIAVIIMGIGGLTALIPPSSSRVITVPESACNAPSSSCARVS